MIVSRDAVLGQWKAVVSAEGDMCLLSEGGRISERWSVLPVSGGKGQLLGQEGGGVGAVIAT